MKTVNFHSISYFIFICHFIVSKKFSLKIVYIYLLNNEKLIFWSHKIIIWSYKIIKIKNWVKHFILLWARVLFLYSFKKLLVIDVT